MEVHFLVHSNDKNYATLRLYRLKAAKVTDKRVKVMNEIISGMRLIKMYAWEWAFHEYVKKIRKLAINHLIYWSICIDVLLEERVELSHKEV